jgi:hypothetical protein
MTPKETMVLGSPQQEDVVQDEEGVRVGILSETEDQSYEVAKFRKSA